MTFSAEWEGLAVSKNENLRRGARSSAIGRARYQCFIDSVAWTLRAAAQKAKVPQFTGPVSVRMEISCPPLMDHFNLVDPLMDALQRSGVLANDRNAIDVHPVRTGKSATTRVIFMVKEVQG